MYFSCLNLNKIALVKAKVAVNNKNIDIESLRTFASKNTWKIFQGLTKRSIAEIHLYLYEEHLSEAEEWIVQAIKEDKKNEMKHQLGHDYAIYAEIFKRKVQKSKARETFCKAIKIFKECGADGWARRYETELSTL